MTSTLKRFALLMVSIVALALAVAPVSFAGEDNSCSNDNSCKKSGGSDTGSASGGAQTGFGGMAVKNTDNGTLAISLASGGLLVLTAAGVAGRRRATVSHDA